MPKGKKPKGKPAKAKSLGAVELFSESVKATLDLKFYLAPLLTIVFGIIAGIGLLVACIPFVLAALASINFLPGLVAIILVAVAVIFLLLAVASAVINGFYYKSVQEYLHSGKISVEKNISFAIKKWKTLTAVSLLEALVWCLMAVGLAVLFVVATIDLVAPQVKALETVGASPAEMLPSMGPLFAVIAVAMLVMVLAVILLNPLLLLWFPVAVFEEKPALHCVKEGWALGKAKYWRNLGALLLLGIISALVVFVQMSDFLFAIGFLLSIWLGLVSVVLTVKAYEDRK